MWISLTQQDVERAIAGLAAIANVTGDDEQVKKDLALIARLRADMKDCLDAGNVAIIDEARRELGEDGTLEFDSDAVISFSEDGGAYVMSWSWLEDAHKVTALETLCVSKGVTFSFERFYSFASGEDTGIMWSIGEDESERAFASHVEAAADCAKHFGWSLPETVAA